MSKDLPTLTLDGNWVQNLCKVNAQATLLCCICICMYMQEKLQHRCPAACQAKSSSIRHSDLQLRHSPSCFLTLLSPTDDILCYLFANATKSGKRSILHLFALSGGLPGSKKTSLNSLKISSQCDVSVPRSLPLLPPPITANTPLVSSSE